jgi:hypothetical protein
MNYETEQDPELEFNEQLRMELGWGEVASGLTQVLVGYGAMFIGTTVGVGLVVFALFGLGDRGIHAKPALGSLWALYSGLGILSVIGLISYGIIIGGQFKCMMGAAERHGARWFMFLCIACVFLGPVFHIASGIASWQAVSELKSHPHRIENFQLNPMGQWLQLIGFGISMLYPLFFILFLRAVAVCLRVGWHAVLVNVFLALAAVLVAGTAFALFNFRPGGKPLPSAPIALLGLGWCVVGVSYVGLIALTRIMIHAVMGQVKSPLAV